jgi:hypothetical protein
VSPRSEGERPANPLRIPAGEVGEVGGVRRRPRRPVLYRRPALSSRPGEPRRCGGTRVGGLRPSRCGAKNEDRASGNLSARDARRFLRDALSATLVAQPARDAQPRARKGQCGQRRPSRLAVRHLYLPLSLSLRTIFPFSPSFFFTRGRDSADSARLESSRLSTSGYIVLIRRAVSGALAARPGTRGPRRGRAKERPRPAAPTDFTRLPS